MKYSSILLLSLSLLSGVASAGGTTEAGIGGALGGVLGSVVGQQILSLIHISEPTRPY